MWSRKYLVLREDPLGTWKKVKDVFKFPKPHLYIGSFGYGLPWYWGGKYTIEPHRYDVDWKDKYGCPRVEFCPAINIIFFGRFQVYIEFGDTDYWEQLLWYLNYCGSDMSKAVSTWKPWNWRYIKYKAKI
jgi:hypothetical protein